MTATAGPVGVGYGLGLGFLSPSLMVADAEHPGLLRVDRRVDGPYGRSDVDVHRCKAIDWCEADVTPELATHGFDTVDLMPLDALPSAFRSVTPGAATAVAYDDQRLVSEPLTCR